MAYVEAVEPGGTIFVSDFNGDPNRPFEYSETHGVSTKDLRFIHKK